MVISDGVLYFQIYGLIKHFTFVVHYLHISMENKLYIKVKCSICRGQKPFSCMYCDSLGESYIEASDKAILRISKAILPPDVLLKMTEGEDDV